MSEELALFPLSNVVLFPRVRTPLHVFEPRYRQMTEHALAGDRRIGMVVVPPEHIERIAGDPPLYPIGCAGVITASQRLPDGRFHIVLDGLWRFRLLDEAPRTPGRLYRVAHVERLGEAYDDAARESVARLRERIVSLVRRLLSQTDAEHASEITPDLFSGIDDEGFVNTLANGLVLDPPDKQGLLEAPGIPERFERLEGLLAFRLAELGLPGAPSSGSVH